MAKFPKTKYRGVRFGEWFVKLTEEEGFSACWNEWSSKVIEINIDYFVNDDVFCDNGTIAETISHELEHALLFKIVFNWLNRAESKKPFDIKKWIKNRELAKIASLAVSEPSPKDMEILKEKCHI
jgi:hypothetical protein